MTRAARYDGLVPASIQATRAARGSSAKRNTKPELLLRQALREMGLRGYRIDVSDLPGRPDVVFRHAQVAIFCDGDFWHGKDLEQRLAKLSGGHNAPYWVKKIGGNVARDRRHDEALIANGWKVLRYWESQVRDDASGIAREVLAIVKNRLVTETVQAGRRRSPK